MDVPIIEENEKIEYIHGAYRVVIPNSYGKLYFSVAGGNCKLCHISDIMDTLIQNEKGTIDKLNEIFRIQNKLCFEVNVSIIKNIEVLNKYFKLVFCNQVPIGYGGRYTYFALFLTNHTFNSSGVTKSSVIERMEAEEEEIKSFNYECQYNNNQLANGENL